MKKGDLSFETIVIAILALVILVILIIVYHKQIAELFGSFGELIKGTTGAAKDIKLK